MSEVYKWFTPDYTEQAKRIKEWNILANSGNMNISMTALELQGNLVKEEGKEVFKALTDKDFKGFIKELCDLFVVTSYMIYLERSFTENKTIDESLFKLTLQEAGRMPSKMLEGLSAALENNWKVAIINNVIGLLTVLDVDGKLALDSVIHNNYSKFKFVIDGEGATTYDAVCSEIEEANRGRYTGVKWEIVGKYVIYKDSKGKIMKPIGFTELG